MENCPLFSGIVPYLTLDTSDQDASIHPKSQYFSSSCQSTVWLNSEFQCKWLIS